MTKIEAVEEILDIYWRIAQSDTGPDPHNPGYPQAIATLAAAVFQYGTRIIEGASDDD